MQVARLPNVKIYYRVQDTSIKTLRIHSVLKMNRCYCKLLLLVIVSHYHCLRQTHWLTMEFVRFKVQAKC